MAGHMDFLEYAMAQDIQPDTTNERIVQLIVEYTDTTDATGYGLYQPEHLLRRYRALLRSFTA